MSNGKPPAINAHEDEFTMQRVLDIMAVGYTYPSQAILDMLVSAVQAVVGMGSVPLVWLSRALGDERVARLLATVGPVLFSTAAFYIAYRFLPNYRATRRSLVWSTLVAMVLFEALKRAFFWYLRTVASYPLVYGPLAGFIVFMIWVYLVAVIVLFGAEVLAVVHDTDLTERARG